VLNQNQQINQSAPLINYLSHFMKKFIACAFLFATCSLSARPVEPSESIDVKRYVFEITINDSTDVVTGIAAITFVPRKNISEFAIDLISKNDQAKGMEIAAITLNGVPLKFEHKNDRVKIALDKPRTTTDEITVIINYKGIPKDGLIISKNKYGDRTFFADNWPDRGRNWLPIVDHPSDKATVEWLVKSPLPYEVVANGVKVEESYLNKNQKQTRYVEEIEIATKVMVIGAARFAIEQAGVVKNIPVESWVYPQNRKEGFYDYAVATKILNYFIENIGPYSYKKLANVQSKTTFGGLENASAIFYNESSVNGKNDHIGLIAHEIAHQWFGNSATEKEWHHIWLSEGFATYFATLYMEAAFGVEKLKAELEQDRKQAVAYFKKNQAPVVDPTVTDWMKLLNPNSYQKGGWVLHMLRREVGDQNFWKGIQDYYKKYQNSNANTDDFKASMENASGKDLDEFFNQWIYKGGHPVLTGSWSYDAKSKTVNINLVQTQKNQVFKFPLEIAIYIEGQAGPQIQKAQIDAENAKLTFPSTSKPLRIELDPNVNLLFEGNLKN
jgi:aminopeptidase N